jgi:hypothetical protein
MVAMLLVVMNRNKNQLPANEFLKHAFLKSLKGTGVLLRIQHCDYPGILKIQQNSGWDFRMF